MENSSLFAKLLRDVAADRINRDEFSREIAKIPLNPHDSLVELAEDEVDDYLRNFEMLNLLGKPVKPDPIQVADGRKTLTILAEAFEKNWGLSEVEKIIRRL